MHGLINSRWTLYPFNYEIPYLNLDIHFINFDYIGN